MNKQQKPAAMLKDARHALRMRQYAAAARFAIAAEYVLYHGKDATQALSDADNDMLEHDISPSICDMRTCISQMEWDCLPRYVYGKRRKLAGLRFGAYINS